MKTTFLQKLAQEIHEKHPDSLEKLCFVFPSKRSGLFFKKELAKLKGTTFWAPQIWTIESFIEELSGLKIISPLEQIFQLYKIHQKLDIQPQLPLEKFIDQAKIILGDFNDIDMALADYKSLFANVKDYVELEQWDPEKQQKSQLTNRYLETFNDLPRYYEEFQDTLLDQNKAYQGLVYRSLEKQISQNNIASIIQISDQWDMIYVAGLNALTTAEKWLFDWFASRKKLEVFFEAEAQMIDDLDQESGKFIRGFAKEKGNKFKWSVDYLTDSTKEINSYAVNGNLAMARTVGALFQEEEKLSHGNETAVILADENLLMPILESLPSNVGDVNVTLGFPLGLTTFMSFAEQLFSMHKLVTERKGNRQFYFKDVVKVITNPMLVSIYDNQEVFENIHSTIIKENRVWINESFLMDLLSKDEILEELKLAFSDWNKEPLLALQFLTEAINRFQDKMEKSGNVDDVLTEQMYFFKTSVLKLKLYLKQLDQRVSLDALKRIFNQVVSPMQVPFSGEPLAGIQIMGLLETRLLSFKNIVFVSVNEGIIPSKGGFQSFLPYALRTGFKIQTHQDRESLFAYHFYRLLSQAENISLIYDTSTQGVGSKEKSRFIRQIEQEWPEKSEDISFSSTVAIFEDEVLAQDEGIEKTPEVLNNIKRYLTERGLSPSALNNFIESPIDFYYKNVIGVYEPKLVNEDVEHNTFGTIVHGCLEEFYKPFKNRVLSAKLLKEAFKGLNEIIIDEFTKEISSHDRGKHYLSYFSVKKYVERFIKLDIEFIEKYDFPITLIGHELKLCASLKVEGLNIKCKGTADRVEVRQGVKYIIDYKTGSVVQKDVAITSTSDLLDDHKPKLVQLLMYAWLQSKQNENCKVVSGIYTLRNTHLELFKATLGKQSEFSNEQLNQFEEYLQVRLKELLDPKELLSRVPDYKFSLFS